MKIFKVFISLLFVLLLSTLISCKNDGPTINLEDDLIGTWLRSDHTPEFEHQLTFYTNHTGLRTERIGNPEGQGISSALMFNWSTNGDVLDLDYDGDLISTNFYFNDEGLLFLSDLTEHHFIKLED